MPELINRNRHEQDFAYGYSAVLADHRSRLLAYGVDRLPERPAEAWTADKEKMAAALLLLLYRPFVDSYNTMVGSNGVIRRPGEIIADFQDWATPYSRTTAGGIVDTTREIAVRAAEELRKYGINARGGDGGQTAMFPTTPQAYAAMRDALTLADVADVNRIARAAITEVTVATSAGERLAVREIERQTGVKLHPHWFTEADDRVCPVCRPRDRRLIVDDVSGFPPAHVGCRCWVDWRPVIGTLAGVR
jgi:hypothetical protein